MKSSSSSSSACAAALLSFWGSKTAGAAGMLYRQSLSTGTVCGGAVDSISGAVTMVIDPMCDYPRA
jgi:hypothetical protein